VDRSLVDDVWHRYILAKVSLFVWRLLCNRLPTKDNLMRRRIIHADADVCAYGCGQPKSPIHLFLECASSNSVWLHVRQWIGISTASPRQLREHFSQFSVMAGMPRSTYSVFKVIWFACLGDMEGS